MRVGRAAVYGPVCTAAETVSPPESPHRLTPARGARSPARQPLPSVDPSLRATRSCALLTGRVVSAIPGLRAVGSALLRPRLRAVGSVGRAGHKAHSTVVHGSAMMHTAEAMPPRLPGHAKLAHE